MKTDVEPALWDMKAGKMNGRSEKASEIMD